MKMGFNFEEFLKEYNNSLDRYESKFGEGFPTECVKSPEMIMKLIDQAIKEGKPYDPEESLRRRGIDPKRIVY